MKELFSINGLNIATVIGYNDDYITCDNCGQSVPEEYLSLDDRITSGGALNICLDCEGNDYGR